MPVGRNIPTKGPESPKDSRPRSANDRYRDIASLLRGIMLTSCINAGARYIPWNQYLIGHSEYYNDWLGIGMCKGLSAKFLQWQRDGRDFVTDVNRSSLEITDRYNKPALNEEIFQNAIRGNVAGEDDSDMHAHMRSAYNFKHVGTETFGNVSSFRSHSRFGEYIGHSPYYYMIHVPGHAMACATQKGRKVFLEPNAGIAHCENMKQIVAFCSAYFGHEKIQSIYGKGKKVVLQAHRYENG